LALEKETHSSARVTRIVICLLVAAFAQTSLKHIHLWLGYIDWLLLVTVYVGLGRDPVVALLTGTAAGMAFDFSTGVPAFGVSGFAYVLAAYIAYWVSANFFVEGVLVRSATVAGASVVSAVTRLFFYKVVLSYSLPASAALELIWGPTLNLIISVVLFAALDQVFGGRGKTRRAEAMRGMKRRRKFKIK
jgi:rod shape-determining protein MreD